MVSVSINRGGNLENSIIFSYHVEHLPDLVSDVTTNNASNVANQFKVKTGLRLHGEGWKVSIVSAMLPKMSLFKDLQSDSLDGNMA